MSLRLLHSLLLAFLLGWTSSVRAGNIEISHVSLNGNDEGYTLDADFQIELNPRLEDAIEKGVALYFEIEFDLTRKRWYWFDDNVGRQLMLRLSYHALTRQYRISSGALYQNFPTLTDALRVLSRVRSWHVLEPGQVSAGAEYQAAIRMRLDVTQLPKPFQVNALTSREWNLASDWRRWPFKISVPVAERPPQ
jgi:hypothetical protein